MEIEYHFDEERFLNYPQEEVGEFKIKLKENVEEVRNEFLISLALSYTQNPNPEFAINKGVTLSQVRLAPSSVSFSIVYNSLASWVYYNGGGESGQDTSFYLVKKLSSEGDFPFSQQLSKGLLVGDKYINKYLSALTSFSFATQERQAYNPKFIYDRASGGGQLKSNANGVIYSGGLYHHLWIVEREELQGTKVKLWQYDVNYGMWYLFALAFTLLPCGIYVGVQLYKERKGGY